MWTSVTCGSCIIHIWSLVCCVCLTKCDCLLQGTLASSWWSTRRTCTSPRTAARPGDRYCTHFLYETVTVTTALQLMFVFEGVWRGAPHFVSGPWRGHRRHQGHVYSTKDPQVWVLTAYQCVMYWSCYRRFSLATPSSIQRIDYLVNLNCP